VLERHFDDELAELKERLLLMGNRVEEIVAKAVKALKERDPDLAREVLRDDAEIDRFEIELEDRCVNLLALRQPMATDLRFITSAIKITNDLERMGDHAVNIAECGLKLSAEPLLKPLVDIPRMAERAIEMMRGSLDSFVNRDTARARSILQSDDEVDQLKGQIFRELLSYMMEDPRTITRAMQLILVSRNLERIADLSTNIAEEVIFINEARVVKHHAEEGTVT
jgi:phosphate transport system protein